jgi:hypothetical protein
MVAGASPRMPVGGCSEVEGIAWLVEASAPRRTDREPLLTDARTTDTLRPAEARSSACYRMNRTNVAAPLRNG